MRYDDDRAGMSAWGRAFLISGIAAIVLLIPSCMFGYPAYDRYQARAYAQNQVTLNDIQIKQTEQLVQVAAQQAQIKIREAQGIAASQRIINRTLTPQYLQHEAIEAQLEAAKNSSHTETIYVPAGPQGIPLSFLQGSSTSAPAK